MEGKWKIKDSDHLPKVDMEKLHRSSQTRFQRNSNGYPQVFGVQEHDGPHVHIVRCTGERKLRDGGHIQEVEVEKRYILASRQDRNGIGHQ